MSPIMQDLEYFSILEKELTKVVSGVWWVQPCGKYRLLCIEMYKTSLFARISVLVCFYRGAYP